MLPEMPSEKGMSELRRGVRMSLVPGKVCSRQWEQQVQRPERD